MLYEGKEEIEKKKQYSPGFGLRTLGLSYTIALLLQSYNKWTVTSPHSDAITNRKTAQKT